VCLPASHLAWQELAQNPTSPDAHKTATPENDFLDKHISTSCELISLCKIAGVESLLPKLDDSDPFIQVSKNT